MSRFDFTTCVLQLAVGLAGLTTHGHSPLGAHDWHDLIYYGLGLFNVSFPAWRLAPVFTKRLTAKP